MVDMSVVTKECWMVDQTAALKGGQKVVHLVMSLVEWKGS